MSQHPAPTHGATALDPYALDREGLVALVAELGEPAYRASQLRGWLARGIDDPEQMTDLPSGLRAQLVERFTRARPTVVEDRVGEDRRTRKLLLRFPDGEAVETVVMPYRDRATVCVSSQAGCALGCPFCATGQAGFRRQLSAGEIIRQVVLADAVLREADSSPSTDRRGRAVTNVVFMGMGEPLANLPATIAAVRWLHDPEGLSLSARGITVSTVGLVPGIRRLAAVGLPVTLAVSLHAATDELRDVLVPINRTHPLAQLEAAVRAYRRVTRRRVTIEWCLIGDVNDDAEQAERLAAIARRLRAHVNVIPMNPTSGVAWREPTSETVEDFVNRVREGGVAVTLRDTRGRDLDAACGQLSAAYTLGAGSRLPAAVGAADRVRDQRGART